MMNTNQPYISIIVPVHNGSEYISGCIEALRDSSYKSFEIIVVDDGSTDDTVEICKRAGVRVIELSDQSGPASARNRGAEEAAGEILLFIDSDVVVRKDTIERVARNFCTDPDLTALFGSYDDEPAAPDFFSQYRNLLHHYVHQRSERYAKTFWAGCGAVRREVFLEEGGFDKKRFEVPSIEDIEFGYRLFERGYKIVLDKELQVKHLKHWGWYSLIRTDILNRALPWSKLIIESKMIPGELNLRISDRISTMFLGLLIIFVLVLLGDLFGLYNSSGMKGISIILILIFFSAIIFLNRDLYGFFLRKRGLRFTLLAVPMHFLYYFYCGLSFVFCWARKKLS